MKIKSWKLLAGAALMNAAFLQSADASFVMFLDDLGDTSAPTIIFDGGTGDLQSLVGAITYSGSIGSSFINVTTGISKPNIGPAQLNLTSVNVSGAACNLVLGLSDTDYAYTASSFLSEYGGTTTGSMSFVFKYDVSNNPFGGVEIADGFFASVPLLTTFSGSEVSSVVADNAYSLSLMAQINHGSSTKVSSFSASIQAVPAPGAALLFGSALLGLFLGRRKFV
jgi:hypothetical protein